MSVRHPDRDEMARMLHQAAMGWPLEKETRPKYVEAVYATVDVIRAMYEDVNTP